MMYYLIQKVLPVYLLIFVSILQFCFTNELCEDPPNISNAHLQEEKPPYPIGTYLHYICNDGYGLKSESSDIVCLHNNETAYWHQNHTIACRPICNDLPAITNGKINYNGTPTFENESISYECASGYYHGQGIPVVTCSIHRDVRSWILPNEPCMPVSCDFPGEIRNAQRFGSVFTFSKNVTYRCNDGYKMKGFPTIICMPTRTWRPSLPSCEVVSCPLLPELENGRIINKELKYKAVAIYECHGNLRLKGSRERICQANGKWSGDAPTCEEVYCAHPGILEHGRIFPNRTGHKAGDVVIFACNDGQTRASKCLETGEWKERPPACTGVHEVDEDETTSSTLNTKSTTDITGSGYKFCTDLGDIQNGQKIINGIAPNITATYSCEVGYKLKGNNILSCSENGKWNSGELPMCVKTISTLAIILIVVGILVVLSGSIGGYFYYQWKVNKIRGYGGISRALATDASDLDEIKQFKKRPRPIPVTVL